MENLLHFPCMLTDFLTMGKKKGLLPESSGSKPFFEVKGNNFMHKWERLGGRFLRLRKSNILDGILRVRIDFLRGKATLHFRRHSNH